MKTTPDNGKRKTLINSPLGMVLKTMLEGKHTGKLGTGALISVLLLGWYGYQEFKGAVADVIVEAKKDMQAEMKKAREEMHAQLEKEKEGWQLEVAELRLQTVNEVQRIYDEVREMQPEPPGPKVHIGEVKVSGGAGGASASGKISPASMEMVAQIEESPEIPVKVKATLKEKAEKGQVKKFLLEDAGPYVEQ